MDQKYTKKDFASDQEVKWCPGCGDYAVLSAAQTAMAQIGKAPHEVVVVSGIGCSSRFPYYMSTYGLHSIHGRAPAFATGIKLQNPNLSVWMITGDGDGLSIGGNHFAHVIRRNLDINILLFNNEIYGLTKGQYSPTSQSGLSTKSSPYGSIDRPFSPFKFSLGAGTTFFARTMDTNPKHMIEIFKEADAHRGTSVIEIYQNCVIFNDKVHDKFTNRQTRDENTIELKAGTPMIFGANKDKGLKSDGRELRIISLADGEIPDIHDPTNISQAHMLSELRTVVPMGVISRTSDVATFNQLVHQQLDAQIMKKGPGKIEDLLYNGDTWELE